MNVKVTVFCDEYYPYYGLGKNWSDGEIEIDKEQLDDFIRIFDEFEEMQAYLGNKYEGVKNDRR
jgi:hypothetical protein